MKGKVAILVLVAFLVLVGGAGFCLAAEPAYRVASDIAWPPFEWVAEDGSYVGFDLDVMREIAKLEGYTIEIVDIAFDSIIPGVIAGKYEYPVIVVLQYHRYASPVPR